MRIRLAFAYTSPAEIGGQPAGDAMEGPREIFVEGPRERLAEGPRERGPSGSAENSSCDSTLPPSSDCQNSAGWSILSRTYLGIPLKRMNGKRMADVSSLLGGVNSLVRGYGRRSTRTRVLHGSRLPSRLEHGEP